MRPIAVLLGSCFVVISSILGLWNPNSPFCPYKKLCVLKRNVQFGEKKKRLIFTHVPSSKRPLFPTLTQCSLVINAQAAMDLPDMFCCGGACSYLLSGKLKHCDVHSDTKVARQSFFLRTASRKFEGILRSQNLRGEAKKPLTRVSKRLPGVYGKRGLERGWQKRLANGWRKVSERSAQGWRRVGKGLAKGRQIPPHPPTFQICKRPFRNKSLRLHGEGTL